MKFKEFDSVRVKKDCDEDGIPKAQCVLLAEDLELL